MRRLIRPVELTGTRRPFWTSGIGVDLWQLFCACISGDLPAVKRLLEKDPALARAYYEYRTPIAFAVRHNQVEVAELEKDVPTVEEAQLFVARAHGYESWTQLAEDTEKRS